MAVQLANGLTKEMMRQGTEQRVEKGRKITVHCTGLLAETGNKFWSTKDPGQQPFAFQVGVGSVISGWDIGCMSMTIGEHARLTCAGHMAYGDRGFPQWGIGPNATLIFDIEVLKQE